MDSFIQVRHLIKIYQMGSEKIYALNDVNLDIDRGQVVCLLGKSGSGKSTLLNALAGLEKPTSGEISIGGIRIDQLTEQQVTRFRSLNIGFVFQSYNLIPTLSAAENVSLGLIFKGVKKQEREKMANEILNAVGLEDRMNHRPNAMSGGQQQRVSITRAFVGNPKIVFADEPTGNLDSKTSLEVMELITNLARKHNQTLIVVTHDDEIIQYADQIMYMRDGYIEKVVFMNKEETK